MWLLRTRRLRRAARQDTVARFYIHRRHIQLLARAQLLAQQSTSFFDRHAVHELPATLCALPEGPRDTPSTRVLEVQRVPSHTDIPNTGTGLRAGRVISPRPFESCLPSHKKNSMLSLPGTSTHTQVLSGTAKVRRTCWSFPTSEQRSKPCC